MENGRCTARRFLFTLAAFTFVATLVYNQQLETFNETQPSQQQPNGNLFISLTEKHMRTTKIYRFLFSH